MIPGISGSRLKSLRSFSEPSFTIEHIPCEPIFDHNRKALRLTESGRIILMMNSDGVGYLAKVVIGNKRNDNQTNYQRIVDSHVPATPRFLEKIAERSFNNWTEFG